MRPCGGKHGGPLVMLVVKRPVQILFVVLEERPRFAILVLFGFFRWVAKSSLLFTRANFLQYWLGIYSPSLFYQLRLGR